MARAKTSFPPTETVPILKTVEQMSKYSEIGINKLRELINNVEIEYLPFAGFREQAQSDG